MTHLVHISRIVACCMVIGIWLGGPALAQRKFPFTVRDASGKVAFRYDVSYRVDCKNCKVTQASRKSATNGIVDAWVIKSESLGQAEVHFRIAIELPERYNHGLARPFIDLEPTNAMKLYGLVPDTVRKNMPWSAFGYACELIYPLDPSVDTTDVEEFAFRLHSWFEGDQKRDTTIEIKKALYYVIDQRAAQRTIMSPVLVLDTPTIPSRVIDVIPETTTMHSTVVVKLDTMDTLSVNSVGRLETVATDTSGFLLPVDIVMSDTLCPFTSDAMYFSDGDSLRLKIYFDCLNTGLGQFRIVAGLENCEKCIRREEKAIVVMAYGLAPGLYHVQILDPLGNPGELMFSIPSRQAVSGSLGQKSALLAMLGISVLSGTLFWYRRKRRRRNAAALERNIESDFTGEGLGVS